MESVSSGILTQFLQETIDKIQNQELEEEKITKLQRFFIEFTNNIDNYIDSEYEDLVECLFIGTYVKNYLIK